MVKIKLFLFFSPASPISVNDINIRKSGPEFLKKTLSKEKKSASPFIFLYSFVSLATKSCSQVL